MGTSERNWDKDRSQGISIKGELELNSQHKIGVATLPTSSRTWLRNVSAHVRDERINF